MEFLRYPHLITTLFNGCVFGPPRNFTCVSTWTRIGHPVSGLRPATICAINTRFPFGFDTEYLNLAPERNSPDRSTKSTLSSLIHECISLQLLVNIGFQVLFHSPPGVLFTFPSLYFFTIGHQVVFRLGGWSLRLPAGFHVSRSTLDTTAHSDLSLTGLSPCIAGFPNTVLLGLCVTFVVRNPKVIAHSGLACFHFARRYFGNRVFFLFLSLLRCFSSRRSLLYTMYSCIVDWAFPNRVPPFGDLWVAGYVHLSTAFRSLSRPSSAPGAKASSLRSSSLDHKFIALQ